MYAVAYCAGEARGVFRARSRGRAKGRERDVADGVARGVSVCRVRAYVQATLPQPIVLAIVVHNLPSHLTRAPIRDDESAFRRLLLR